MRKPAIFQAGAAVPTVQLVPTSDRAQLPRLRTFFRITTVAQCRAAVKALRWLKARIVAIEEHRQLNAVIEKRKADLEAARAVKRAALAVYVPLEERIRNEIARFRSTQHRERERLQRQRAPTLPPPKARGIFQPNPVDVVPAPVTLEPLPKLEAGWREWWRWTLVDPARPLTRDDEPIENVEAGIKALAAAVAKGRAPWQLLQVNPEFAQALVDEQKRELRVPGLVVWVEVRPILTPLPEQSS